MIFSWNYALGSPAQPVLKKKNKIHVIESDSDSESNDSVDNYNKVRQSSTPKVLSTSKINHANVKLPPESKKRSIYQDTSNNSFTSKRLLLLQTYI